MAVRELCVYIDAIEPLTVCIISTTASFLLLHCRRSRQIIARSRELSRKLDVMAAAAACFESAPLSRHYEWLTNIMESSFAAGQPVDKADMICCVFIVVSSDEFSSTG